MRISDWSSDVCSSDLIFATAVILQYMAGGILWVEARPRIQPQYWIAAGLFIAGIAGVSAWWVAKPLLSALGWHFSLPVVDRKRVVSGKSMLGSVDLGGRRIITKKRKKQKQQKH